MRIAFLADPSSPNAWYRAIGPMVELAKQGHEVRQVIHFDGYRSELVRGCDVVHIHRQHEDRALRIARYAKEHGLGLVWDNDDDFSAVPKESVAYRTYGGLRGERILKEVRRMAGIADVVTTPSAHLAEVLRGYGADDVRVIENYVRDESVAQADPPREDARVMIGWMGGDEHHLDAERMPLRGVLRRLLDARDDVRVVTIGGVTLDATHPRHRHIARVPFAELDRELARFDVGLAPIADIALNHSRSNVKLKEYAVVGVPWLASPIGPYVAMGEREGGRLVPEDGWHAAIERLLDKPRERRKLAKRARKWGRGQTISAHADRWLATLEDAVARARGGVGRERA